MSVSFEATFPPTPQGVGAMRRDVAAFAHRAGLDEEDIRALISTTLRESLGRRVA